MLRKVTIKNGCIVENCGEKISPCKNLDVHTWNIKIEEGCIRCKSFSGAVIESHSVTRFPLKDCTIYLINKIDTAFCYQRDRFIQEFLDKYSIDVVTSIEKEDVSSFDDDRFKWLENEALTDIWFSPLDKEWAITEVDDGFRTLYFSKESQLKRFFRDKSCISELEIEMQLLFNLEVIPEEFRIYPPKKGFYETEEENPTKYYVSKINSGFVIRTCSKFHQDLIRGLNEHFEYVMFDYTVERSDMDLFNGIEKYRDKIIPVGFMGMPPKAVNHKYIDYIDSRYWEPIELK